MSPTNNIEFDKLTIGVPEPSTRQHCLPVSSESGFILRGLRRKDAVAWADA